LLKARQHLKLYTLYLKLSKGYLFFNFLWALQDTQPTLYYIAMKKYNAEELIRKYLAGNCTPEEKALIESWHLNDLAGSTNLPDEEQVDAVHQRMQQTLAEHIRAQARHRPVIKRLWFRATAAAVVAGIMGIAMYWYVTSSTDKVDRPTPPSALSAIQPGHNGAILTLEDGRTMELDSMGHVRLPMQNGTKLSFHNGQLKYQVINKNTTTRTYNTITTTRGRQFKVALPDGSQVWLNAASSITYPVAFTGNEREVFVTGETYFEVAPLLRAGQKIPFKVTKGNTEIQVLGTHFNVNAYDDEPDMKVTLLEGSVKVKSEVGSPSAAGGLPQAQQKSDKNSQASDFIPPNGGKTSVLKPGEQISITHTSQLSQPIPVQTEQVIAWKNDIFNFQDATLEQVMRQLARWYDIEVRYEQGIPNIAFEGAMSRQNKLADVLHSLEGLGVRFRLEGERRLVVLP
jgi:transmembrane sensor